MIFLNVRGEHAATPCVDSHRGIIPADNELPRVVRTFKISLASG